MLFAILAWRILSIDFRTPAVPQADGLSEVEPPSSTCNFKSRFNQFEKGRIVASIIRLSSIRYLIPWPHMLSLIRQDEKIDFENDEHYSGVLSNFVRHTTR
jgi:hypothetical protein